MTVYHILPTYFREAVLADHYVTIEDAAIEAGVAERTIHQWKKDGKIRETRDLRRHIRVCLEDVMDCRSGQSESPLRTQVKQLQAKIATLSEQMIGELHTQQDLGEQLLHALNKTEEEGAETPMWSHLTKLFENHRSYPFMEGGLRAMPSKRGLPVEGTLRLRNFADAHCYAIHEVKKLYDAGIIGLTVYNRPGEQKRKKRKWWISQPEQKSLITYWEQNNISYTPCPLCPHTDISISALIDPG